jgi:hypothetical protein
MLIFSKRIIACFHWITVIFKHNFIFKFKNINSIKTYKLRILINIFKKRILTLVFYLIVDKFVIRNILKIVFFYFLNRRLPTVLRFYGFVLLRFFVCIIDIFYLKAFRISFQYLYLGQHLFLDMPFFVAAQID